MGALFLFKHGSQDLNLEAVANIFDKKGFSTPQVFALGPMTLWLYRKQLVPEQNFLTLGDGSALYVTGTLVYKGLSYRESQMAVLEDFKQERIDFNALFGSFCLIFNVNGQIKILTDRLCTHHLFMDVNTSRLSTSFLALLASFERSQLLNRMAFYEKISTGFVVAPDTLVSSILQLNPQLQAQSRDQAFSFLIPPDGEPVKVCSQGFVPCVDHQLKVLIDYFSQIKALSLKYGTSLGLSGGYDSRLLLLLARRCAIPFSLYTHLTEGVHDQEYRIAKQIAKHVGIELYVVKTKPIDVLDEPDRINILRDNLYYFDARNANNVGAFTETYTRSYLQRTIQGCLLELNGKGGEIYRNYSFTMQKEVNFLLWWENHACFTHARFAISDARAWAELRSRVLEKIQDRLQADVQHKVNFLTVRRYYSEIKVAECDANINNAHNQMVFHLMPFAEPSALLNGYAATPYLGASGQFEAEMLSRLDKTIAGEESHYGFPLNREPLGYKINAWLRGYTPNSLRLARIHFLHRYRNLGQANLNNYHMMRKGSPIISEIEDAFRTFFPKLDWNILMSNYRSRTNALYMGLFLLEFGSQVR